MFQISSIALTQSSARGQPAVVDWDLQEVVCERGYVVLVRFLGGLRKSLLRAWRHSTPRHRSYVVYVLLAPVVAVIVTHLAVNLSSAACLRDVVDADPMVTLAQLEAGDCQGEPFVSIREAFDVEGASLIQESEGVSAASARTWTVVFATLIGGTVASSVAGAAMALVTTGPDVTMRGWAWGAALTSGGALVAALITAPNTTALFVINVDRPDGGATVVDYSALMDPFGAVTLFIAVLGGAVIAAALVGIGYDLDRRNSTHDDVMAIDEYQRVATTAAVLVLALTATISLGVLSTGARIRLMEHLPGAGEFPGFLSVLYGMLFSLIIAALYVPTRIRLDVARERLVEQHAGVDVDVGGLEHREALRKEIDRGVHGSAGGLIAVLGPFVSAASSAVLA